MLCSYHHYTTVIQVALARLSCDILKWSTQHRTVERCSGLIPVMAGASAAVIGKSVLRLCVVNR